MEILLHFILKLVTNAIGFKIIENLYGIYYNNIYHSKITHNFYSDNLSQLNYI